MSELDEFRAAGRALFSLRLVHGAEGNLSTFDGHALLITRTGAPLGALADDDVVAGTLEGRVEGASTDLQVHRRMYEEYGPGAVAHAHPPGTVPEAGAMPGEHGMYAFGATLGEAVDDIVRRAREVAGSGESSGEPPAGGGG